MKNCQHNGESAEWLNAEMEAKNVWLEYVAKYGLPDDIPARPDLVYVDEWQGWQHWLGWTKEKTSK